MILNNDWDQVLQEEFCKTYFLNLQDFLAEEEKISPIYPPKPLIFNAFQRSSFSETKVVILGQDPYHGAKQAHGLAFSVQDGIKPPPSLKNIYKELAASVPGFVSPNSGNLTSWANQGVLLLNTTLTVSAGKPASHQKQGWEIFTDKIIQTLSEKKDHLVFLLWGKHAQDKEPLIDHNKHLILKAPHPSPFSAHSGFFGCNHFPKTNQYLQEKNREPIDWAIHDKLLLPTLF